MTPPTDTSGSPSNQNDTIFLSYARADDVKPPEESDGWVTFFWKNLRFELTDRGAKQAVLWLDRYQIDPAEAFTPKIEQALAQTRMLITVLSENWVQRGWCQEEVDYFGKQHADACERVVLVYKSNLDQKLVPDLLKERQSREGYRFFELDEDTGKIYEFYWRGIRNREAYIELIKQIALFIIDRLGITPAKPNAALRPVVNQIGKTVFVALTVGDLKDARQRLVNDLKASGFTVVPEDTVLLETGEAFEAAINESLIKAEYAVHLIGENHGITVEGGVEPIVDQQLRLARRAGLPRILWVPRWLPNQDNQKNDKRDPFEVMQRFDGLLEKEEIHHGEITDLSQWLRQRAQSKPINSGSGKVRMDSPNCDRILVAAAHEADEEQAIELANHIQKCGLTVQPYFSDDNAPSTEELNHTQILILWGEASDAELESMLDRLTTSVQVICLRLPGGDERAKRRFFRENVLLEKIDTLPGNRDETWKLLDELGIAIQTPHSGDSA